MMRVEAIFGGVLALFVLGVAIYALATTQFPGDGAPSVVDDSGATTPFVQVNAAGADKVCGCYNRGFKLAGKNVGVQSSQYRTGFEQCRAMAGVAGGDAWTAGWNARIDNRHYEASCRAYRKRSA
ncbi:MAG: hypothetical protein AAGC56_01525 [Pseudomonadota bacterium]